MAIEDRLEVVLSRMSPCTREYAEHLIREWVRNLPTAVALAEALEMKDRAREILDAGEISTSAARELARLETTADRTIRSLDIPADAVFRGERTFRQRYIDGDNTSDG